jgi:hypothetical protein
MRLSCSLVRSDAACRTVLSNALRVESETKRSRSIALLGRRTTLPLPGGVFNPFHGTVRLPDVPLSSTDTSPAS